MRIVGRRVLVYAASTCGFSPYPGLWHTRLKRGNIGRLAQMQEGMVIGMLIIRDPAKLTSSLSGGAVSTSTSPQLIQPPLDSPG